MDKSKTEARTKAAAVAREAAAAASYRKSAGDPEKLRKALLTVKAALSLGIISYSDLSPRGEE